VVAVPVEGSAQPLLQAHGGLPAQALPDLRRVHVLAVDLALRIAGATDVRLDPGAGEPRDQRHHLTDRVGPSPARVEDLPADVVAVERVDDRQIRGRRVLHVEEVALRVPSERSTGARPSSAALTASGTRREKFRSPP
jgi:hypothetical protein